MYYHVLLFLQNTVTTNVFAVTVTQTNSCSIEVTCHFAIGSTADGCRVLCRARWSQQANEEFVLLRETPSDNNVTLSISIDTFPENVLIDVEAVGVQDDRITDTHSVITSFWVIHEPGMDCQHNSRMLICMN